LAPSYFNSADVNNFLLQDLVKLSVDRLQSRSSANAAVVGGAKRSASSEMHDQYVPLTMDVIVVS
jgi:hypothetical protein